MSENESQIVEETIKALYLDLKEEDFIQFSSFLNECFGNYIDFTWKSEPEKYIDEINSGKYDIIFTEIEFGDIFGNPRATIAKIMEQPGAADIPVIVITSCDDTALPINAFRNGITEYFTKFNLNKPLMEYRIRNLLQREFRTKIISKQFDDSLGRFQKMHGMSQDEIKDLNSIVALMKKELEEEYREKMKLEEERNKIKSLFGMYVDPAIVTGILNNDIAINEGKKQELTVLFTDIRGYTALTEKLDPEQVLSFLNEYFTAMTEVLMGYEGIVDKYIGDSIMCLFGAPIYKENHRDNAVETAVEMQNVFELWQPTWKKTYNIFPTMGIGISSGTAVVGNIGSFQKRSYTAVGDTVNVASRLEALAKPGEILVARDVQQNINPSLLEKFIFEPMEPIAIKGKSGLHQIFKLRHN